jgi:hypothetical protein
MVAIKDNVEQLFGGKSIDITRAMNDAAMLGLIESDSKTVAPTRLGMRFSRLNPEKRFEANTGQLSLLRECAHMTLLGKEVVELVSAGKDEKARALPLLDALYPTASDDPEKRKMIDRSVATATGGISEEELEEQLREKRAYGGKAEEYVLVFEKQRLIREGMPEESERVRRVGNLDVTLGYDIESFSGKGELPDRFIEVKCTKNPFMRFYWSSREVEVAKKLGEGYFIYFVWIDENEKPSGVEIIRDPAKTVLQDNTRFLVSVGTLVVQRL